MNKEMHAETDECQKWHCAFHQVDEPVGEVMCGECWHYFADLNALLADTNALLRSMGLPEETDPNKIWICPFCAHDF